MAKFVGTVGDDTLTGGIDDDFIYGYGGSDTLTGLDGNDRLYGGDGADMLYGGAGNDNVDGGLGADFMAGGLGDDTYVVDDMNDVVSEAAGEGTDTVKSFLLDYRLTANVENLVLAGSFGQTGRGNDLDNKIKGNDYNNSLFGYGGNDVLFGYGGDDLINPGDGVDLVDGGAGTDLVTYKVGSTHGYTADLSHTVVDGMSTTFRNVENLEGSNFADNLYGDAGANKISGLDGDDFIRGRAGNDDLAGGAGADTFRFEAAGAANGVDVVRTFQTGIDVLEFHTTDGYAANAGFTTGSAAVGAGAQFVFNPISHELFYDPDGAGGAAQIKLASVLGSTVVAGDIHII